MQSKTIVIVMMSAVLMSASLSLPTYAQDHEGEDGDVDAKDEAVYGNLDAGGTLQDLYVVNTFHLTEPGEIEDYGNYTDVRNLSNLYDMEQTDDTVRFQADEEEFYYQGEMDNRPLPWDINISYMLDGEEVAPDELAGQDGELDIQITTSENEDVDRVFYENYMLQISLTLDPSIFNDIQAPEGTQATSGKDTQVTFAVMPESEETFILSANVTDFEMDPMDISATPASMSIDDPDLDGVEDDMQSLSNAIGDLNDGVIDLNDGITELNTGAGDLSDGSNDYRTGINELDQSSDELVAGSAAIRDELQGLSESVQDSPEMPDLGELEALPEGIGDLSDGLYEAADGLDELKTNYEEAYGQMDEAMMAIPDEDINDEQIEALYESGADPEVVDQLVEAYSSARAAKETYDSVHEAFGSVTDTLEQISGSTREMADNIETMSADIEQATENTDELDALTDLQDGLSTFASEYESFHSGLVDYTDGVGELAGSYGELDDGIQDLEDGTASLEDGANELQEGTQELQEETSDLPDEMQSEVDEMMDEYDGSDFEPVSFVDDENEDVEIVQFVLQTESIEMEEPETTEEDGDEEPGFWERLLDLFR